MSSVSKIPGSREAMRSRVGKMMKVTGWGGGKRKRTREDEISLVEVKARKAKRKTEGYLD